MKMLKMILTGIGTVLLAVFLFCFPRESALAVATGFQKVTNSLLPALFPALVLSGFVFSSSLKDKLDRLLYPAVGRLFKISREESSALIFGFLCGFPTGIMLSKKLYDSKSISKDGFNRLTLFANNCGAGFIFSFLAGRFSSKAALCVFLAQFCSAIVLSRLSLFFYSPGKSQKTHSGAHPSFVIAFTDSVRQAAVILCYTGGFIIFFSFVCACVKEILSGIFGSGLDWEILISPLMELTSGTLALSALPGGLILCAGAVGWSGLCIWAQSAATAGDARLPKEYLPFKALNALLCLIFCKAISFFVL